MEYRGAAFAIVLAAASLAYGQEPRGRIEGTVLNQEGKVVWQGYCQANMMSIRAIGPTKVETSPVSGLGNSRPIIERNLRGEETYEKPSEN